jgi:hypothetical protein
MGLFKNLLGTVLDEFRIGRGNASDKYLYANIRTTNRPNLRWNNSTEKWEFSNNGTSWTEMGSGGGGAVPVQEDEVEVVAEPTALDFAGNFDVTDVSGVAKITLKSLPQTLQDPLFVTNWLDNPTNGAGDVTVGNAFVCRQACLIPGARFRTARTGAHTVHVRLYGTAGLLASALSVACSGPGEFYAYFSTAYEVGNDEVGDTFRIAIYETDGAGFSSEVKPLPTVPLALGQSYLLLAVGQWAYGDADPTTPSSLNLASIDPIIEVDAVRNRYNLVAMVTGENTELASDFVVGAVGITGSELVSLTVKFAVCGFVTNSGLTGTVSLYNVTDASLVTSLTFTELISTMKKSSALSLPAGAKVYEVRIKVTGGTGPSDLIQCMWAGIELS